MSRGISRWLKHDQPRQIGPRQVLEHGSGARCRQDDRRISALDQRADGVGDGVHDSAGRFLAQRLGRANLALARRGQPVIKPRAQAHDPQAAVGPAILLGDLPRQAPGAPARSRRSMSLVLPACTASVSRIVSRSRIPTRSRSRFCKTRCNSPARKTPGTTSLASVGADERTRSSSRSTCSRVRDLVGMARDDLAEMAGDHRRGFQHPAARQLGELAAVGMNPDGRLARHRVHAVAAVGASDQPRRRHRQQPARMRNPLTHHGPANLDAILVRRQPNLIVNPHLRNDQAHFARDPLAHRLEQIEQVSTPSRVGQPDQPESDLELERVDMQQIFHPVRSDIELRHPSRAALPSLVLARAARTGDGLSSGRLGLRRRSPHHATRRGFVEAALVVALESAQKSPRPRAHLPGSKAAPWAAASGAMSPRNTAAVPSTAGFENNWPVTSRLKSVDDDDRVTISPAASEIKNAGIWLTRPSPIVSFVKTFTASPGLMP